MKKKLIALGGVFALGVAACTSIAWYTGTLLPGRVDDLLVQANEQLRVALGHNGEARIELLSLDARTFGSDARYRVTYTAAGKEPVQLEFADRIEYGPLPWSRVKRLQLLPVMAASNLSLVETEASAAWLATMKHEGSLQAQLSVDYGGSISSSVELESFGLEEGGLSVSFSGVRLYLDSTKEEETARISGVVGLIRAHKKETGITFDLKDITVNAQLGAGADGLRTGWVATSASGAEARMAGRVMSLGRVTQEDTYQVAEDGYSVRQVFSASNVRAESISIGSARLAWRVEGLDPLAWKDFLQGPTGDDFDAVVLRLLASNPRVALEELSLKSPRGEARADLVAQLQSPGVEKISYDDLIGQAVGSVQANFNVSKALIDHLGHYFETPRMQVMGWHGQRTTLWEELSAAARSNPLLAVTDDGVLMNLRLAKPDDVELNGKKLSMDEFAEMFGQGSAH
ncbi:MAG TPA: hypothetical protein DIT18_17175 [Pseudomonas sp.]|nr:hypothetical protein [Pseudomonas sp.]